MPKLTIQQGYQQVNDFQIPKGDTFIGREDSCNLRLPLQGVSRRHARINYDESVVVIEDLGSRNGTFLNGTPISQVTTLKHGDVIQIGDAMLLYNEKGDVLTEGNTVHPTVVDGKVPGEKKEKFDIPYLQKTVDKICANIAKVVEGKDEIIRKVILGVLSDGHVLIEDVPGTGKTVLSRALAKSINSEFKRIQFTPDLLPSDVTGVNVYDEQSGQFTFLPGPIFGNIVLADEINRGTPRVQSSLLECMSEARVTIDGRTHTLRKPFFVIATQNPIDFHGTYPLPEAQLDRFLMRLSIGYPENNIEKQILENQITSHPLDSISHVTSANDILQCQALVRTVHVSEPVRDYIVTIIDATRKHPAFTYGCSPRAALALMRACQALAATEGRDYVLPRDARDLAPDILSHRLPLRLQARSEWENSKAVIASILDEYPLAKWEKEQKSKGA